MSETVFGLTLRHQCPSCDMTDSEWGFADGWNELFREVAARTCGTCEFYDANSSATEGVGYCTNPVGWHKAKPLPPHEMCSKWEKRDE